MTNLSKGTLRLPGRSINGQSVSCTGLQLVEILMILKVRLTDHRWLIADVSTNDGKIPAEIIFGQLSIISSTEELIEISSNIDQYLSGIFLSIPMRINNPRMRILLDTEDDPTLDLEDSILEIRAFDTTYFEVYSSELDILRVISNHFKLGDQH
jgi:hypothetical protein